MEDGSLRNHRLLSLESMTEEFDFGGNAAQIPPKERTPEAGDPAAHVEIYRRYVTQTLCWLDGTPTHSSSDLQRQCPKCRQKWSYERLGMELELLDLYCQGLSASAAARQIRCAKNTALNRFGHFSARMQEIVATKLVDEGIATSPITVREAKSLEKALRTGNRRRRENVCRHLFFTGLSFEERMQGVFLKHISGQVKEWIDRAKSKRPYLFHSMSFGVFRRPEKIHRTFRQSCVDLARRARMRMEARFNPNCPHPSKSCQRQGHLWVKVWEKARSIRQQAQGGPLP
jgi:hypothetical protein